MVDIARYDDTSNACMFLAQMCRQARTADIPRADLAATRSRASMVECFSCRPAAAELASRPQASANRIVRRWVSRQHRTFFIAGLMDELRNGSRFVAIVWRVVRTTVFSADPRQDERTRRGAMPKSRRQGRDRHWYGPLSQHRPRHLRRLQVGNLVAYQLRRARG